MRSRVFVTISLIVLAALSAPADQPPAPAPQPPAGAANQQPAVTFKVEINYVEIDAVVTDPQGNFVRGLTKNDFQVVEDGTPQTITAFAHVDLPIERADPPMFRRAVIEPDVRSNNEQFNGRVILLVLDDLQTDFRRTPRVRAAARQFIERYVGANDMVAIVQTGGRAEGAQDFTNSRTRLLAAVDKFMGQKLPSATLTTLDDYYRQRSLGTGNAPRDLQEMERSYKARSALGSLANLADYLAGIRGRRKAIVWIGEGIDYDVDNPFQSRDASVVRDEIRGVIEAATRANVSFYGVDARGLGAGLDEAIDIVSLPDDPTLNLGVGSLQNEVRRAQDSLRVISDETGGFAVVNQNDLNAAFERIIQDNSSYYVIGYYATNERRDGRFRKIDVRVTRPGLRVRSRKGYTAARGKSAAPTTSKAENEASPALREALASPLPASGLGISVFAAPFMGKQPKVSLALTIEFEPGRLKFVEKDGLFTEDLEIVMFAVNSKGKTEDGARDTAPLKLSPRSYESVSRNGLRLTRRLELSPGRYQLRVGAREANGGAVGTVVYDLDLPDFTKSPLHMSGIALASAWAAARTLTANPDPEFKDVLPAPPTAVREFPRNDTLAYFTEVYDNMPAPAHRVAIRTSVLADDGREVFSTSDERRSEDLAGKKGAYGHTGSVPLKDLAPGRYVLRIDAKTLLSNGGTASRELEFRVR